MGGGVDARSMCSIRSTCRSKPSEDDAPWRDGDERVFPDREDDERDEREERDDPTRSPTRAVLEAAALDASPPQPVASCAMWKGDRLWRGGPRRSGGRRPDEGDDRPCARVVARLASGRRGASRA